MVKARGEQFLFDQLKLSGFLLSLFHKHIAEHNQLEIIIL